MKDVGVVEGLELVFGIAPVVLMHLCATFWDLLGNQVKLDHKRDDKIRNTAVKKPRNHVCLTGPGFIQRIVKPHEDFKSKFCFMAGVLDRCLILMKSVAMQSELSIKVRRVLTLARHVNLPS